MMRPDRARPAIPNSIPSRSPRSAALNQLNIVAVFDTEEELPNGEHAGVSLPYMAWNTRR